MLDQTGEIRIRFQVTRSAKGLAELLRRLERYGSPDGRPIAIERPSGLLVDTLVEADLRVVPIHPNQVKASRPSYAAALSKSDAGDAYILADLLRTDGHRLQELRVPSDATRALRVLVRTRDDLVAPRVNAAQILVELGEDRGRFTSAQ